MTKGVLLRTQNWMENQGNERRTKKLTASVVVDLREVSQRREDTGYEIVYLYPTSMNSGYKLLTIKYSTSFIFKLWIKFSYSSFVNILVLINNVFSH